MTILAALLFALSLLLNCAHDGSNNVPPIPPEPDPTAVPAMHQHDGGVG